MFPFPQKMEIVNEDNFEAVLNRFQPLAAEIFALVGDRVKIFTPETLPTDLQYFEHYVPRKHGLSPVYLLRRAGEVFRFFGARRIRSLLPKELIVLEDEDPPMNYQVTVDDHGILRDHYQSDNYSVITEQTI